MDPLSHRTRRRTLLLEVLIAMGLFAAGAAVLFKGPILLWKMQQQEWTRLAIQWEVDHQMLLKMSRLLEQPEAPWPEGEELITPTAGGFGGRAHRSLRLRWHCSTLPVQPAREPTDGIRVLLIAEVTGEPRPIRIQRSLYIPAERLPGA